MTMRLLLLIVTILIPGSSSESDPNASYWKPPRKSLPWSPPRSLFSKILKDLRAIKRSGLRLRKEHRLMKKSVDDIMKALGLGCGEDCGCFTIDDGLVLMDDMLLHKDQLHRRTWRKVQDCSKRGKNKVIWD